MLLPELRRLMNAGSLYISARVLWELLSLAITGVAAVALIILLFRAISLFA